MKDCELTMSDYELTRYSDALMAKVVRGEITLDESERRLLRAVGFNLNNE